LPIDDTSIKLFVINQLCRHDDVKNAVLLGIRFRQHQIELFRLFANMLEQLLNAKHKLVDGRLPISTTLHR
jgi:hypothetical protein